MTKRKNLPKRRNTTKAAPASKKAAMKVSDTTVAYSRIPAKAAAKPFVIAAHPPSVTRNMPQRAGMAMDDTINESLAWATQIAAQSAFAEGVTFLGYPYLSELSQRVEYRRVAEITATEMTRKFIKLQSADQAEENDPDKIDELDPDHDPDLDDDKEVIDALTGKPTKPEAASNTPDDEKTDAGAGDDKRKKLQAHDAMMFGKPAPKAGEALLNKEPPPLKNAGGLPGSRQSIPGEKPGLGQQPDKPIVDADKTNKIKQIENEMKRLDVAGVFRKAAILDALFGRGHIFIDLGTTDDRDELRTPIGDAMAENEISKTKVPKDGLKALRVIEPVWCYPTNYNSMNPLTSDWYRPRSWFVQGTEVHSSRLLTLIGREVPDLLKPAYSFGGLSLSQMIKPYVDNWLRTRQSVSDLVHSFSVFVLKTNMSAVLQGESADELFKRIDTFNNCRDNRGLMAIDKDSEEFSNVSATIASLDHLQAQAQEHIASACGIPLVKLLGISPSGLNASSEGELRVFYDWINAYQEALFTKSLTKVLGFIQLSLFGEVDPSITFSYEALWSLDEKAMSDMRKTEADTGIALINAGVISPEEERKRVASDADSPYHSIDVNQMPEPPAPDPSAMFGGVPGATPEGGNDPFGKGSMGPSENDGPPGAKAATVTQPSPGAKPLAPVTAPSPKPTVPKAAR